MKTLDEIINECQQPAVVNVECDECFGGGIQNKLYPSGHTEVRCEKCNGEGYIEEELD